MTGINLFDLLTLLQTMFVDLDANMDCEVTLEEYMNEMAKKDTIART